jgi:hypothetical protein
MFSAPLQCFSGRINSAIADRAADQKPCREKKEVKSGGLLQEGCTGGRGKCSPRNISQPYWTYAIKTATWNARVTQRIAHEKKWLEVPT